MGEPLSRAYERDWFQARMADAGLATLGSFVPQPPANALLLAPLAGLPPRTAQAAWAVVLAAAVAASWWIVRAALPAPAALTALAFLIPSAALANALAYGQPYPLLLLCLCLSLAAARRGWPAVAGALIAPVLVLKLYGVPFVLYFAVRRPPAFLGLAAGALALVTASLAVLGFGIHQAYVREVLPASLAGAVQDPYSTVWGSAASLAHRLFQLEPDLNPHPALDAPWLARALARGLPLAFVAAALAGAAGDREDSRREWTILTLAALAAAPLTATYHFVLLSLPAAVLASEEWSHARPRRVALVLALLAFATSAAPHYFARFASGWGNLIAYPRLAAVLALLVLAIGRPRWPRALAGAAAGLILGAAVTAAPMEEPWTRLTKPSGYLLAEPAACRDGLAWVTIAEGRLAVRGPHGRILPGPGHAVAPRCTAGGAVAVSAPGQGCDAALADCASGVVAVDAAGALRDRDEAGRPRLLASGLLRGPRVSPDGRWIAYQSWDGRSWDLRAVERDTGRIVAVTSDAANEVEPAWLLDGAGLVFASDRRRGLGSTALYRVPFAPDAGSP